MLSAREPIRGRSAVSRPEPETDRDRHVGAIGWTGVPEEHLSFLKHAGCPPRPAADRFGVPEEHLSFLGNAGCQADLVRAEGGVPHIGRCVRGRPGQLARRRSGSSASGAKRGSVAARCETRSRTRFQVWRTASGRRA